MAATFLWYDLETFGRDPRWDRIAQFAAIRTDTDLNPLGDPIVLFGRISPDYLPNPEACLITGLTPKKTAEGMIEAELAAEVHAILSHPGTCAVGYNSLRFDDEFVRNLLYRNFYDPYRREYAAGNSRWDILPLVRMAHDLRPEGITWAYEPDGRPSFTLESLAAANGVAHEHAHDALSDVRATRALAELVRSRQRRLFDFYLGLRGKDSVRRILNLQHPEPVVYTAPIFSRPGGTSSIVLPVSVSPRNGNEIIAFDLRSDPEILASVSREEMRRRVFGTREEQAGEDRIPLVGVAINKVPAVAPLSTLTDERAEALGLSVQEARERAERLIHLLDTDRGIGTAIRGAFEAPGGSGYRDPDLNMYSGGFFGDEDQAAFHVIHATPPAELPSRAPEFADPRGPEMFRRYIARNWPDVLSETDRRRWLSHCAGRILAPEYDRALDLENYRKKIHNLMARSDVSPRDKRILQDLREYGEWLDRNVLTHT